MKETSNQQPATRKGFTTLEIILVVALLSLIVVAIAPFFRTTVAGWELKDRQLEVLQIGRMGMDEMTRKLKGATSFSKAEERLFIMMKTEMLRLTKRKYARFLLH